MREKIDYRNNIEQLNLKFPDKDMLNISDVARFTGFDRKKVKKVFGKDFKVFGDGGRQAISKAALARLIS